MTRRFTFLILALLALIGGPGWGQAREDLALTFDLSSNPGDWPTANSTTLTNYTYTLDDVDYTFALKNVKCNSGYLMMTSTAVLGLPAIENYKLTKVVASNSGGCSTSTKVGISSSSSSASYISGGEIQTWSTTNSSYTYNLSETEANTMYYMYVTNKNAQVVQLILTYESTSASTDPSITVNPTTITWDDSPINVELSKTISVSQANLTEGITISSAIGTITPSTIAVGEDATDVTFIYTPTSVGDFEGGITFTSGETTATVSVTGSAYDPSQVVTYEKVTSVNDLVAGASYILVCPTKDKAAGAMGSNAYFSSEDATLTDNTATSDDAIELVLGGTTDAWTFTTSEGLIGTTEAKKLNHAGNGTTTWTIDITSGEATITSTDTEYGSIKYNASAPRFLNYASGQTAVALYKKVNSSSVATPTFTPAAGIYDVAQNVTIACATEGATIYYTLDGTDPDEESEEYTSEIEISETTTIKAIAYLNGEASDIATAEYEIVELYDIYCMSLPDGGGSVTTSPAQKAAEGTEVTITVTPAEHYSFTPNSLAVTGESSTTIEVNPVPGTVGEYTFVMPAEDVTITAQFTLAVSYTVTIAENIQHGKVTIVENEYYEGATVQLTVEPDPNYGLVSLTIIKTQGGSATGIKPVLNVENGKYEFAMPAYDITVRATFGQDFYTRVNNVANLVPGKHYIIVGKKNGTYYAMGNQNDNNRAAVEIEVTETTVQVPASSMHEFTISGDETNHYTFYELGLGYLYAAGANSNNHLKTETDLDEDDKGKWSVTFNENGEAIIISQATNCSRNTMRFNTSNNPPIFSCYSSGQQPVYLYMKENDINNNIYSDTYIDGDISNCLFFSVGKGAALTVTGTIDANIMMFSIVDGSQLIYDNDIPNGTIANRFRKYADDEADQRTAWNLVSVPIKNFNLLPGINITGDYDLYSYNEPTHFWINKKEPANPYIQTTIGTGYLFAMPLSNTHARFGGTGILQGSGQDLSFPLSYTETLADGETNVLKGFNLVGNPFTCNAYVNMDYLVLDETGSNFVNPTSPIKPGDAILVQATAEGQEITFTRNAPTEPENRLDISVSQNRGSIIDNARIRFGGSHAMNKFYLNENSTRLYIPQDGQDFAIVSSSTMEGELPVNFKAEKNGTFTITVNTKNVDAEYLHLIDNMTGMDIDLLATDSYTFDALTNDYAYRFKLVFGMTGVEENALTSSANFAYISNGNLVIDNIECETTLKIVDELGRIISTETVNGSYNKALNLKAGLYIINLNGMTQKIVVE